MASKLSRSIDLFTMIAHQTSPKGQTKKIATSKVFIPRQGYTRAGAFCSFTSANQPQPDLRYGALPAESRHHRALAQGSCPFPAPVTMGPNDAPVRPRVPWHEMTIFCTHGACTPRRKTGEPTNWPILSANDLTSARVQSLKASPLSIAPRRRQQPKLVVEKAAT